MSGAVWPNLESLLLAIASTHRVQNSKSSLSAEGKEKHGTLATAFKEGSMENEAIPPVQNTEIIEKGDEASGSSGIGNSIGIPAGSRMEVSAQTIARMMGIASATDLQLLEGRLDLLATKVSTLMIKVDKIATNLGAVASAGDVGRLETQLAAIKTMVRDAVEVLGTLNGGATSASKDAAELQSRKLREGIRSSSE